MSLKKHPVPRHITEPNSSDSYGPELKKHFNHPGRETEAGWSRSCPEGHQEKETLLSFLCYLG